MPDELRTMTFDIRDDFKISPESQREDKQRVQAFLTSLDYLLAQGVSLTSLSPVPLGSIRNLLKDVWDQVSFQRVVDLSVEREDVGTLLQLDQLLTSATRAAAGLTADNVQSVQEELRDARKLIRDLYIKTAIKHEPDEKQLRALLGDKTQAVNEAIERELRKHLPAFVSVLANVEFRQSSFAVLGTITILSWAGRIFVDATKEEAAKELSELVKVAVRRSINYAFELITQPLSRILGLDLKVRAVDVETSTLIARPETSPSTDSDSMATRAAVRQTRTIGHSIQSIRLMPTAVILLSLILLLVMVLFVDRFFTIHLRTAAAATPSSSATPSASPSPSYPTVMKSPPV